jgi:cobyric acid synthase
MSTACSPTTGSARRGLRAFKGTTNIAYEASVERTLDALAAHLAAHLDLDRLLSLAR